MSDPTTRAEEGAIYYTVLYKGDPAGARILNGEPAPGRAVGVMLGDLFEKYDAEDKKADELIRVAESRAALAEAEVADLRRPLAACMADLERGGLSKRVYSDTALGAELEAAEASASALRDRVAVLESALKPFAKAGELFDGLRTRDTGQEYSLCSGNDLRTARAALKESTHAK